MEHGFDSRRRYQKSSSFDEDFFCLYSLSLRNEEKLRTHTLPSKARYFHVTTPLLSNENEFRTHTLPSKVRYFHVTPPLSHTPTSNVRYIAFSMGTHNYHIPRYGNYSGGCKAIYLTLLKDVCLSDIERMAEVRNVPHLARKV